MKNKFSFLFATTFFLAPHFSFADDVVKRKPQTLLAGNGAVSESEESKAFQEALQKAQGGDAEAQFKVGKNYQSGNSKAGIVAKDLALAESWYLKAARQGHHGAILATHYIYSEKAREAVRKKKNDSDAIAEAIKWSLLSRGLEKWKWDKWDVVPLTEATKAEGEKRAKAFRDENNLTVKSYGK